MRLARKFICALPRQADGHHFDRAWREGRIELELVSQGNLEERIRAAGAGIGGFLKLQLSGSRYARCTMCIGVGQGIAPELGRVQGNRPPVPGYL